MSRCPESLDEVRIAILRKGCGNDQNGRNRYMCISSQDRSSLKEFCYQGVMRLQEKGNNKLCVVQNIC